MCSRCRSFDLDPTDKLGACGFGRCAHLDVWYYRSRYATPCYFTPSRLVEVK
jgi:hypothetical protein